MYPIYLSIPFLINIWVFSNSLLLLKCCSEHTCVCLLINTHAFSVSSKKCVRFVSVETAKMFSQVFVPILTPTSSV